MKTVEATPLGTFDVHWGVGSPAEVLGATEKLKGMSRSAILRDPLHGEEKALDAYRLGGRVVLLGELSNGIWAVGVEV